MFSRSLSLPLLASLALLASGCAKELPPVPQPYPVRGKVLLTGHQPLHGGTVTFRPVGGADDRRYQGWGFPKADGTFEVAASGTAAGLAPGKYKVTVSPKDEGEPRGSNANAIPRKYRSEATTPLEVEVKPAENNLAPFVLQ